MLNRRSPDRAIAACAAWRPSDVHSVLPLFTSTAKYCPAFLVDIPNSVSPARTASLRRIGTSVFSQAVSTTHCVPFLLTRYAEVGGPLPLDTTRRSPVTMGVVELVKLGLTKGRSQRRAPEAASMLTSFPWVIVTICRVPPNSARTGDPYPGPSPRQLHLTSPDARSKAVMAPSSCPPTWKMTLLPLTMGEKECDVYIGTIADPGFCQSCFPDAAS